MNRASKPRHGEGLWTRDGLDVTAPNLPGSDPRHVKVAVASRAWFTPAEAAANAERIVTAVNACPGTRGAAPKTLLLECERHNSAIGHHGIRHAYDRRRRHERGTRRHRPGGRRRGKRTLRNGRNRVEMSLEQATNVLADFRMRRGL